MRSTLLLVTVFFCCGCVGCVVYGPEHLPALRVARDVHRRQAEVYQGIIVKIEMEHNIASRDGVSQAKQEELARQERERLEREREAAKAEAEWLATLTPEQRFQYVLHKQRMELEERKRRTSTLNAHLSKPEINIKNETSSFSSSSASCASPFYEWP